MQSAPRRGCGRDYTGLCFRGELGTERVASPLPLQPPSTTELRLSSKRALLLLPHTKLGSEPCSRSRTLPGGSEGLMCVQDTYRCLSVNGAGMVSSVPVRREDPAGQEQGLVSDKKRQVPCNNLPCPWWHRPVQHCSLGSLSASLVPCPQLS